MGGLQIKRFLGNNKKNNKPFKMETYETDEINLEKKQNLSRTQKKILINIICKKNLIFVKFQ